MKMCNDNIGLTIIMKKKKIGSLYTPYPLKTKEARVKYANVKYPQLKVGDRVIYDEMKGIAMDDPLDGDKLLITKYEDIEGKLE